MRIVGMVFALLLALPTAAGVKLSEQGKPLVQIVQAEDCTAPTRFASGQLAETLGTITGAKFEIVTAPNTTLGTIFVGTSPAAKVAFPDVELKGLLPDEIVMKSTARAILLAGSGPRGDLYAVSRFLQEQCGVRWWTPWASQVPTHINLTVNALNIRYRSPFELREPFWMPAFDPVWAARNACNGQSAKIPAELGDCIRYKGFVHTFYPLVPPEKYFQEHPEWYSLLKGKRTHDRAQLCTTNAKLREFMVERVKEWLRESRDARIISVSQNDWYGACECDTCKALDDREGSHSGTMLDLVNYIAEKIQSEFPDVAVDTLAYQYTRKPPKTLRPRQNVIVRLCSIECNFREPLDHPSNAKFAQDIKGWGALTDRLYIWDYTTDFAHYVQPHPNWFTLGPNVRFFANNHVRGLFEQGAYQSHGSEMAELRAWVLAQLLWNPAQDDRALIREFLDGYYGAAAPHIFEYLEQMHRSSIGHNLTCYSSTDAPFLQYKTLAPAERLWSKAEEAVKSDPVLLTRVRLGHLPLRYVWLSRWNKLRKEADSSPEPWPLDSDFGKVVDEWKTVVAGRPGEPWTQVTLLNEGGLTPESFLKRLTP